MTINKKLNKKIIENTDNNTQEIIKVRRCIFSLFKKITTFQVIIILIIASIIGSLTLLNQILHINITSSLIITAIISIVVVIDILSVLIIFYNWRNTFYKIEPETCEISYARRHLNKNLVSIFTLNENTDSKLVQGYMGKLFNCGNIILTGPTIEKDVILKDVPNPIQNLENIETMIASKDQSTNLIETNII